MTMRDELGTNNQQHQYHHHHHHEQAEYESQYHHHHDDSSNTIVIDMMSQEQEEQQEEEDIVSSSQHHQQENDPVGVTIANTNGIVVDSMKRRKKRVDGSISSTTINGSSSSVSYYNYNGVSPSLPPRRTRRTKRSSSTTIGSSSSNINTTKLIRTIRRSMKHMNGMQWTGCILLTVGVCMITIQLIMTILLDSTSSSNNTAMMPDEDIISAPRHSPHDHHDRRHHHHQHHDSLREEVEKHHRNRRRQQAAALHGDNDNDDEDEQKKNQDNKNENENENDDEQRHHHHLEEQQQQHHHRRPPDPEEVKASEDTTTTTTKNTRKKDEGGGGFLGGALAGFGHYGTTNNKKDDDINHKKKKKKDDWNTFSYISLEDAFHRYRVDAIRAYELKEAAAAASHSRFSNLFNLGMGAGSDEQIQQQRKEEEDDKRRKLDATTISIKTIHQILREWLHQLDHTMINNIDDGIRWIRPYLLPPIPARHATSNDEQEEEEDFMVKRGGRNGGRGGGRNGGRGGRSTDGEFGEDSTFYRVYREKPEKTAMKSSYFYTTNSKNEADADKQEKQQKKDETTTTTDKTMLLDGRHMKWEDEWEEWKKENGYTERQGNGVGVAENEDFDFDVIVQPAVDYTKRDLYKYPSYMSEPPQDGGYPHMTTMKQLLQRWPQDDDYNSHVYGSDHIIEELLTFDYQNETELRAATRFRDAELPFKVYNVPELHDANRKWTDEYLSANFDHHHEPSSSSIRKRVHDAAAAISAGQIIPDKQQQTRSTTTTQSSSYEKYKQASGTAQESINNFFAFFNSKNWDIKSMGLAPTRNNDWSYGHWSKHAKYADAMRLNSSKPHFYYQAGVSPYERHEPYSTWTFISRDLPSWSKPEDEGPTFFVFQPEYQKGIQCRFGERGITAATHYDSGRNMIAMILGAKRYILSPPNQCSKLGIHTKRSSSVYRHSLLNFQHIQYLDDKDNNEGMSNEEREWLKRAATALSVETVLKAGEVLYIPSHWFHYITSVQKSAQCNARSGVDVDGTEEFGGYDDVDKCVDKE